MFIMLVKPASSFQKNPTPVPALRIYRGMLGHLHFLSRQPSLRQARCFGDSKAIGGHWKAHVEHTLLCQTVSRLSSTVTRVQQCAIVQIESEFCLDRETTLTVTCLGFRRISDAYVSGKVITCSGGSPTRTCSGGSPTRMYPNCV